MSRIHIEVVAFDTLGWIWGARVYLDEMERTLPEAEQRERDALDDLANELDWKYEAYSEEKSELESKWEYWIPRVLSYSMITLLHTIVETQLIALCRRLREIHNVPLKINEVSGDPIERSQIYLSKVIDLTVGNDPDWSSLRDLAKLRNIIVHRAGAIGDEPKQREEVGHLVEKYGPEFEVHIGYMRFSFRLCRNFLDKVEAFFRRLFAAAGLPDRAVRKQ